MQAKFKIRYYGHPDLRQKVNQVEKITAEICKISEDMVETMVSLENCIGFAGPQLGVMLRIFVIREEKLSDDGSYYFAPPEVIINPVLTSPSKEMVQMVEGCMSFPGVRVNVIRPKSIHAKYMNFQGEVIEEELKDFRARVFMHENDHLNGVLHIDRMDAKERRELEPTLKALKKKYHSF